MLAQRAAKESPRWTRAVEDQSALIPEERASKLGVAKGLGQVPFVLAERAHSESARSMRAVNGSLGHSLVDVCNKGGDGV